MTPWAVSGRGLVAARAQGAHFIHTTQITSYKPKIGNKRIPQECLTDLVRVDNTAEECLAGVAAHATVMEVGHGDVSTHRAVYHGLVGRGRGHRDSRDDRGGGGDDYRDSTGVEQQKGQIQV